MAVACVAGATDAAREAPQTRRESPSRRDDVIPRRLVARSPSSRTGVAPRLSCPCHRRRTLSPRHPAGDVVTGPHRSGSPCARSAQSVAREPRVTATRVPRNGRTLRGECVPPCDFPLGLLRKTAGCGMLAITFVHFRGRGGVRRPCRDVCGECGLRRLVSAVCYMCIPPRSVLVVRSACSLVQWCGGRVVRRYRAE